MSTPIDSERLAISVRGAVQGVGFRPFVYRMARDLGLSGWVRNSSQGVDIEVEGPHDVLECFTLRLESELPPRAVVQSLEITVLDPIGLSDFEIRHSEGDDRPSVLMLPDIAPCEDCLREIADPTNRRHRYPFTNCTNCGPRFTVIEALPYDRVRTTMQGFTMCTACASEYDDPKDRRFHAQPNACPACGPMVELWDRFGEPLARGDEALRRAADLVRSGQILALKGMGGFQLIVDARNDAAVTCLRERKAREQKPFAVLFSDIAAVLLRCEVSEAEARLLVAPEAPIVLLRRRPGIDIAPSVAPDNPNLGVMLPSTPLHQILANDLGFPVVATSGNWTDEPICIEEREVVSRLGTIADAFLVHNRPIARHCDDSVVRVIRGREVMLRRARGYAPLPVECFSTPSYVPVPVGDVAPTVLAVGGHLKNTVALFVRNQAFMSQHIGDLDSPEAQEVFEHVVKDLLSLYGVTLSAVAHDLHPDYASTKWLKVNLKGIPRIGIQHHHAHLAACLAENQVADSVLGVTWDGSGFGPDGTVWGGEFLVGDVRRARRVAKLRTFRLPGGERAVREPRRSALGLLYEVAGPDIFDIHDGSAFARLSYLRPGSSVIRPACMESFSFSELSVLQRMLTQNLNSPLTSSAGRLFDAVAALLGLRQRSSFEGQAAMELEFAVEEAVSDEAYKVVIRQSRTLLIVDWEPMLRSMLFDLFEGIDRGRIASRFHEWLTLSIVEVARRVGVERVALTGGVFQNRVLTERTILALEQSGFRVFTHRLIPPNDGGISLGQAVVAAARLMAMQGGKGVFGRAG